MQFNGMLSTSLSWGAFLKIYGTARNAYYSSKFKNLSDSFMKTARVFFSNSESFNFIKHLISVYFRHASGIIWMTIVIYSSIRILFLPFDPASKARHFFILPITLACFLYFKKIPQKKILSIFKGSMVYKFLNIKI